MEALRGAQESLQRESLLALQLETTEPETIRMIRELGFGLHRYDPITRTLKKAESADYRHNAIYIRDLAAVDRRVRSSPRFNVLGQEI